MDYQLEKKLRFNTEPKFKSLYSWSISEIEANGEASGRDQVPWHWTLWFTATELVLSDGISVKPDMPADDEFPEKPGVVESRSINAKLRSGYRRGDGWERPTRYSMFGTDREIKDFRVDIYPLADPSERENCHAWGVVSYTAEIDFRDETMDDAIGFNLMVKPEAFERFARRIADGTADELVLRVGRVHGFYSEWSPEISTSRVKVLVGGRDQVLELPADTERKLPRLGLVGETELNINAVRSQAREVTDAVDDEPPISPLLGPADLGSSTAPPTRPDPQLVKLLGSIKTAAWIIAAAAIVTTAAVVF